MENRFCLTRSRVLFRVYYCG